MNRLEFIALMLSPLLVPFVKKAVFDPNEHCMTFPNGSKVYHYTNNPIPYDTYPTRYFTISEAERKKWLEGDWYIRDEIIRRHKGG